MRTQLTLAAVGIALASALASQQAVLRSQSPVGVFVRMDGGAPSLRMAASGVGVTVAQPMSLTIDDPGSASQTPIMVHTKASLRILDRLPAVRIYESGSSGKLMPPAKVRQAGTTASTSTQGLAPGPHSWLLQFQDTPGRRLRLQVRYRSSRRGSSVRGAAHIDIGNDKTAEFQESLDARSHVRDFAVTVPANGILLVKIETEVLWWSSLNEEPSYAATLDVSLEPVDLVGASFVRYGRSCGPRIGGLVWKEAAGRKVNIWLENGSRYSPAALIFGSRMLSVALPGSSCLVLTDPLVTLLGSTNGVGQMSNVFSNIPLGLELIIHSQYGVLNNSGNLDTSDAGTLELAPAGLAGFRYFDLNHILSTGQSLATGTMGSPALSKGQPFRNKMFAGGICGLPSNTLTSLVESKVETMSSGMVNLITKLAEDEVFKGQPQPRNTHETLVSCHAADGKLYRDLKRGSAYYIKGMSEVQYAMSAAIAQRRSYVVRAITASGTSSTMQTWWSGSATTRRMSRR